MKARQKTVCGVLAVILALTFAACGDDNGGGGGNIAVTFSSVSADGSSSQTTTQLTLTFSQAITGLTAADITLSGVSGVSKGTLSGSGPTYTLPISGFTLGGTLAVSVSKSGYDISDSPQSTTIYYYSSGDPVCDCNGVEEDCECGNCECEICDTIDPTHVHDWGEWAVTTPATCTTPGVETRTCTTDAHHTQTQAIAINSNAHHWSEWVVTTPATETQDGEEKRTCAHNASHVETNALAALNHTHVWGEWEVTTTPTCTEKGERERVCESNSNHKDYEDIDPTGHDQGELYTTPATCTTTGTKELRCTVDNVVLETDTIAIDPNAHHWNNSYTVTTPATCSATGTETDTCSHNASHTRTLTVAINPNAHHWNNSYTVTTPATCMATGIETDTCSHNVSHTRTRTVAVNPNAHDYQWVQTTAPSLIEEGMETEVCSRCAGEGETRNNAALPITTTQEWIDALSLLNGRTGEYILTISGNIGAAGSTNNSFGTTTENYLAVTLKGNGKLYLTSQGNLICIAANQTLIIDSPDLTLQGLKIDQNEATQNNNTSVVLVSDNAAILELRNGTISGNTINVSPYIGGVYGGGVNVNSGSFIMNGGTISGNETVPLPGGTTLAYGNGVYVGSGSFIMNGGVINGNTSSTSYCYGGGVCVGSGTFTMTNGEINGNTSYVGGGIYLDTNSSLTMSGGTISGNTASNRGGGVIMNYSTFRIVTGTVYGLDADEGLKNIANSGATIDIFNYSTVEHGTFSGSTWNYMGTLTATNDTIRVVNGVLQQ